MINYHIFNSDGELITNFTSFVQIQVTDVILIEETRLEYKVLKRVIVVTPTYSIVKLYI